MGMKNLLVAVDFSDASNLVVQKAGDLAQQLSARIVLLHRGYAAYDLNCWQIFSSAPTDLSHGTPPTP